jgi:hypothetical protein
MTSMRAVSKVTFYFSLKPPPAKQVDLWGKPKAEILKIEAESTLVVFLFSIFGFLAFHVPPRPLHPPKSVGFRIRVK